MTGVMKNIVRTLKSMRLYAGKDLRRVEGPCVVFFPVNDTEIRCGLAGFVSIKGFKTPGDNGLPGDSPITWEQYPPAAWTASSRGPFPCRTT